MLNRATLMGRLTADPELRHTQQNTPVVSFTLAVGRSFSRSENPETDFIDIVAWRQTAEFVSKWFKKGQLVAVSGRIQSRNWEDRNGNKRKSVELVADEVFFAESKRDSAPRNDDFAVPMPTDDNFPSGDSDFTALSGDDGELPF